MVLLVLNFEPCKVFEYPHPNHPIGWKGSTGLSFKFVVIILRADWSHSWWNTFWVLHAWHIQVVKHVKHRMCGEPILPYVPNIYQSSIFITLILNLGKCLSGNMPCTDSMHGGSWWGTLFANGTNNDDGTQLYTPAHLSGHVATALEVMRSSIGGGIVKS